MLQIISLTIYIDVEIHTHTYIYGTYRARKDKFILLGCELTMRESNQVQVSTETSQQGRDESQRVRTAWNYLDGCGMGMGMGGTKGTTGRAAVE